jgi:hypothetical protein
MSKPTNNLDNYPLFYEELGRSRERSLEPGKKEPAFDRTPGLSEDQLAKLSDDLRTPLKEPADSNPMQ